MKHYFHKQDYKPKISSPLARYVWSVEDLTSDSDASTERDDNSSKQRQRGKLVLRGPRKPTPGLEVGGAQKEHGLDQENIDPALQNTSAPMRRSTAMPPWSAPMQRESQASQPRSRPAAAQSPDDTVDEAAEGNSSILKAMFHAKGRMPVAQGSHMQAGFGVDDHMVDDEEESDAELPEAWDDDDGDSEPPWKRRRLQQEAEDLESAAARWRGPDGLREMDPADYFANR